ncbi:DUF4177 domain-containing protein [Paracoccus siganidrum]|uniref:DUF4177 domain-containing protein n=1 Tax=Paracoccus siganidrum TaxID=1276757 RepID=A0A418ZXE9_9RHOB|nr:DUF4177 domain-containing protein [Paracoccus siganidrum]RJL05209.1 DUF4177 domain-containing protein [Paracoccus siganidrum]RMC29770.1 DUF4177 domain-containing protein [Paracoccus siganidrum]
MAFEYTVIAAPDRGEKSRSAKTPADRYALALAAELNRMAGDGWDYVRAETLPSEERSGLTGRATIYHNVLVFRRAKPAADIRSEGIARRPQPEYPASATPMRDPEPTPRLPESAAPMKSDHAAAPAEDNAAPDSTPPAPRKGSDPA